MPSSECVHDAVPHTVALHLLNGEDYVLVHLLVHGKFSGLTERTIAAWVIALERLLLRVYVHMFLQVLRQRKRLETQCADVLLDGLV